MTNTTLMNTMTCAHQNRRKCAFTRAQKLGFTGVEGITPSSVEVTILSLVISILAETLTRSNERLEGRQWR